MGKKKTIYVIIMLFLGAGILFCGGAIKMGQMKDEENEQLYSGYAEPTTESNAEDDAETEYVPVRVEWSALRKKNNEVVGWSWVGRGQGLLPQTQYWKTIQQVRNTVYSGRL